jgi:choline dehydrogenase-like flavoprotein
VPLAVRDLETFDVVVDTLLPALPGDSPAWTMAGSELKLSSGLPAVFESLPHDSDRRDLKLFLKLLDSPGGGLVLFGRRKRLRDLTPDERAAAVRSMLGSRVEVVRKGVRALKTLAALLWVTTDDPAHPPVSWSAMTYPGPDGQPPPDARPRMPTVPIDKDTTLDCDVVVVGSGAGGGVAAGVLAAAGLRVIILERGGYHDRSDFTHLEADAYASMYLDGGLGSSADGGILMLAGSTLGGGTVINYTTSFPTPQAVREEWDRVAGFDDVFAGDDFGTSLRSVGESLVTNLDNCSPSARDRILDKGLRNMGWHVDEMPRNVSGCTEEDCGYCTMGCRTGAKRSMLATYLHDASENGARIVVGCDATVIDVDGGRAAGVHARVGEHDLRVRAGAVVVAAGALNTPALLLRSGIGGPAVGRYLRLHPVTAVWGRFEERVEPWTGRMQTRYSDEFADLDGRGYGFKFETAPIHPLFPAAFVGWQDGASFKRDILGLGQLGVAGVLLRDRDHGRVTLGRDGRPRWRYRISSYDRAHIREGVRRGAEVLAAAGAVEVFNSSAMPVRWRPDRESIDGYVARSDTIGYGPHQTSYFSFHQMGTARMGSDHQNSVVDANNEVHDAPGVYVMDGSCFPTASGVNPMISIAAIAHRGATLLAQRMA